MNNKFISKINIDNFSIEDIDIGEIERIQSKLPRNGVIDLNIAERLLIFTLEGQNLCQEKITQIDRWCGYLEGLKNKAWSNAALVKAKEKGYKTAKDKEWYAAADDDYIKILNKITIAKAAKKWMENKSGYFSSWHYALKTFIRRDYLIENSTNMTVRAYNTRGAGEDFGSAIGQENDNGDFCDNGEIDWG